ncbi:hypothetical protein [Pseudomonas sp. 25 R 14]|nr:hypothetical protein [Pseudomonas sp. 25 R 14]
MSWLARTTRPPTINGVYSSRPKMSKENVVSDSRRSCTPIPGAAAMLTMKLVSAPWRTITPLGLPVEPEV